MFTFIPGFETRGFPVHFDKIRQSKGLSYFRQGLECPYNQQTGNALTLTVDIIENVTPDIYKISCMHKQTV